MPDVNSAEFWDAAYRDDRDGWDMGTPTPLFASLLERHGRDLRSLGGPDFSSRQDAVRVALPCSGRGYDAQLFARHGFAVTAIDFSALALEALRAESAALDILQTDLFHLPGARPAYFDLIVEYTCVCAIEPARRAELVAVFDSILRPDGVLLMLLFPVDGRPGGPPFSIDPDEWRALMAPRFDLLHDEIPDDSVKPRRGKERLMLWRKRAAEER
jgi:SAM-dependent methyltransferase